MSEPEHIENCQEPGNYKGSCCCNCQFQVLLKGHPWNAVNKADTLMYGCAAWYYMHSVLNLEGISDRSRPGVVRIMEDRQHSMCENHTPLTAEQKALRHLHNPSTETLERK